MGTLISYLPQKNILIYRGNSAQGVHRITDKTLQDGGDCRTGTFCKSDRIVQQHGSEEEMNICD